MSKNQETSKEVEKLIQKYQAAHREDNKEIDEATISVDEIAKRVASFYDRIRAIIDWKGEHLLRRSAIERNLRRRALPKVKILDDNENKKEVDAEKLILELIRAGHLPNNKIPRSKIEETQKALDKYVYILNNLPEKDNEYAKNMYQWLTSIAACEVEEILSLTIKEKALIELMFTQMKEKVVIEEGLYDEIPDEEKETMLYIAVQRALFNLDEPLISYHLFKYNHPDWKNLSQDKLETITKKLFKIREKLDYYFDHKLETKLYHICQDHNTPYLVLGDVITENINEPQEVISNPQSLEKELKSAYDKRVDTLQQRLSRSAIYSTLSIFITNVAALYVLEIPLARLIGYEPQTSYTVAIWGMNYPISAIAGTILVPTVLMAILVLTITTPDKENLHKAIMETMKVVYKQKEHDKLTVKESRDRSFISNLVINFIWFLSLAGTLSVIAFGLYLFHFPPLSYVIFIIFLSLIAFAGIKIRDRAKELHMTDKKDTLGRVLLDIFALPVIRLGKWLTTKWKKYNIISIFFNALIDMPFMSFIRFLEQWRNFLKEKREDIY